MSKGGKRPNSGRKKIIGKELKIIIKHDILEEIMQCFQGKTRNEKIRNCILSGLKKEKDGKY